jgi:hypothetical protein
MANLTPDPNKIYDIRKDKKISEAEVLSKFTDEMMGLSKALEDEAIDILRCHLMVEHYLTKYLIKEGALKDNAKTRNMMFGKKLNKFHPTDQRVSPYRPAIERLNKVRNGYVHDLGYKVQKADIEEIINCVKTLKPYGSPESLIGWIEVFTMRVCALLHWDTIEIREA